MILDLLIYKDPFIARLGDIAMLLIVLYLCYALADKYLSRFIPIKFSSGIEKFIFLEGLGVGILSYFTFLFGILGLLYGPLFYLLLLISIVLVRDKLFALMVSTKSIRIDASLIIKNKFVSAIAMIFSIFIVGNIIGALAPPMGWDELWYHLPIAKAFAQNHHIFNMPGNMRSSFFMAQDMLYVLGILIKGDILAKLFHFAMGILAAIAVYSFSRNYMPLKASLLAALIFYTVPFVSWLSTVAYVDLALLFYEVLALYAVVKGLTTRNNKWILFGAIFCGFAIGTKLLAVISVLSLLFLILFNKLSNKENISSVIILAIKFVAITLMVSIVWYLRNYVYTGNPVFPLMNNIFRSGLWYPSFSFFEPGVVVPTVVGNSLIDYLMLPWNLTFALYPLKEQEFGPIFIMFIPLLFLFVLAKHHKINEALKHLIVYSAAFIFLWAVLAPLGRHLLPIIPVLSIIASYAIFTLFEFKNACRLNALLVFVLCLVLLSHPAFTPYWLKRGAAPLPKYRLVAALGLVSREDYLSANLGTTSGHGFPATTFINNNLAENSKVLTINILPYYINKKIVSELSYQPSLKGSLAEAILSEKDADIINKLKSGGITHIAVNLMGPLNVTDKLSSLAHKRQIFLIYSDYGINIYSLNDRAAKGVIKMTQADIDINGYRQQLLKDPNDIIANLRLAAISGTRADIWNRDYNSSILYAKKVLSMEPNNLPAYMCLAYDHWAKETFINWSGDKKTKMDSYNTSVELYKKSLTIEPKNPLAVTGLIYNYCSTGSFGPIVSAEIKKLKSLMSYNILSTKIIAAASVFLFFDKISRIILLIILPLFMGTLLLRGRPQNDTVTCIMVYVWVVLIIINYYPVFFLPFAKLLFSFM